MNHLLRKLVQGRKINDIDKVAEITLVHETQGGYGDEEMFDTGVLDDEEVFVGQELWHDKIDNVAKKDVKYYEIDEDKIKSVSDEELALAMIDADYQIPQQMQAKEQEKLSIKEKSKLFVQLLKYEKVHTFVDIDTELVEGSEVRAEAEIAQESSSNRAGIKLEQESIKKQKVDEDKEIAELQR
ncbi:hypothetical protein Tco_0749181 [Tanacetum coccineum]|uniref:DUF2382 domain-containing protein n=1 Tax=Tanacetum coccineum TaxID=301880 RepID=A0ABQ4YYP0_9ASTR